MIVAMDTDGVLRKWALSVETVYKRYYPDHKISGKRGRIDRWNLAEIFPIGKEIWKFIYRDHAEEIFLEAEKYTGAGFFMEWLNKKHYVKVITAQPDPRSEKLTVRWFELNNIKYDEFVCTHDKEKEEFDIIVEDSPKQIPKLIDAGKDVIRFLRVWNEHLTDVPTVKSFNELMFKINELNKRS